MTTFGTLLRKDWRVHRPAVVTGLLLAPVPVLFAMAATWTSAGQTDVRAMLLTLDNIAALVVVVVSAVFGATTFAGERRDGSAQFLALLPPPAWAVVLSKVLVSTACLLGFMCLLVWCSRAVFWLTGVSYPRQFLFAGSLIGSLQEWSRGPSFLTFAFGVFLSARMSTPALAAAYAMIGAIVFLTLGEIFVRPLLLVSPQLRSSPELRGVVFTAVPGVAGTLVIGSAMLRLLRRNGI